MPQGALSANSMNSGTYAGKQAVMRSNEGLAIIANEGFLGPYPHDRSLKVGDIQSMVFLPEDAPPWYAPDAPQFDTVQSHPDGTPVRNPDGTPKISNGYVGKPKELKQTSCGSEDSGTLRTITTNRR